MQGRMAPGWWSMDRHVSGLRCQNADFRVTQDASDFALPKHRAFCRLSIDAEPVDLASLAMLLRPDCIA
jgi:hypothetical protein